MGGCVSRKDAVGDDTGVAVESASGDPRMWSDSQRAHALRVLAGDPRALRDAGDGGDGDGRKKKTKKKKKKKAKSGEAVEKKTKRRSEDDSLQSPTMGAFSEEEAHGGGANGHHPPRRVVVGWAEGDGEPPPLVTEERPPMPVTRQRSSGSAVGRGSQQSRSRPMIATVADVLNATVKTTASSNGSSHGSRRRRRAAGDTDEMSSVRSDEPSGIETPNSFMSGNTIGSHSRATTPANRFNPLSLSSLHAEIGTKATFKLDPLTGKRIVVGSSHTSATSSQGSNNGSPNASEKGATPENRSGYSSRSGSPQSLTRTAERAAPDTRRQASMSPMPRGAPSNLAPVRVHSNNSPNFFRRNVFGSPKSNGVDAMSLKSVATVSNGSVILSPQRQTSSLLSSPLSAASGSVKNESTANGTMDPTDYEAEARALNARRVSLAPMSRAGYRMNRDAGFQ